MYICANGMPSEALYRSLSTHEILSRKAKCVAINTDKQAAAYTISSTSDSDQEEEVSFAASISALTLLVRARSLTDF